MFLFGSEIKSFLEHPQFEKRLNEKQLEYYLTYQYSPSDTTFFEDVYKLLPAHWLLWKDGKIKIQRYWQADFVADNTKGKEEWEAEIDSVLQDSVNVHKISDVEVGSFLSSGVDSGYITYLAGIEKTFTVGFNKQVENGDCKYNETKLAQKFSQSMGIKNTVYQISPNEFFQELPKIQYYMDEPLADAASVALYFLNREASKKVKVCLSGEGADELFGGYHIYKEPFMCEKYERLPFVLRKGVGKIASLFPTRRGINFLVRHSVPLKERYIGTTTLFTEKEKKKFMKRFFGGVCAVNVIPIYLKELVYRKSCESLSYKEKIENDVTYMQMVDLHLWLAGDILLKADKMSMANSLELRVPFLDKEVFEVARQIPTIYRVNAKKTKIALRASASKQIGIEHANREKLGFPIPIKEWLREEPYVSLVKEVFQRPSANQFFHTKQLNQLLELHVSGKQDCWRKIWCVYVFLVWYEVYFGEK